MEEIKETCYKGTRIVLGNDKRDIIEGMVITLRSLGFEEISMPIIQFQEIFSGKVGEENNKMMFNFSDRADRQICLAPEYTAVIQQLAKTTFKDQKDVKLFYIQECFRGEKPQAGRYRQFTQLGVEIINPTKDYSEELRDIADDLVGEMGYLLWARGKIVNIGDFRKMVKTNIGVRRGLDYYQEGSGFEIVCESLGAQKQVVGGGTYEGGIGFAIGIDRLLTLQNDKKEE